MNLLKILVIVINFISISYMLYYLVIAVFAFKKDKVKFKNTIQKKFAVIIPARNEELVIGNLIKSLNSQNYPKDKYDLFVLPNNCDDNTEEVAKNNNAQIIDCTNIITKSKGDVLRYAFKTLRNENYDAYLIFDADNIVHPDFIQEMNYTLVSGYRVAQGYRDSKNPSDTWTSSSHSLHYIIQNYFMNRARNNINKSCFVNGTGFMISKEYLEENGYNSLTITEDIELNVNCGLNNEQIAFVENAITYDEQPITFDVSWKQRKRWSVGTLQCLKSYWSKIIKDIIKNKNLGSVESIMFLTAPIVQLIGTFNIVLQVVVDFLTYRKINYVSKSILLILYYISNIMLTIGILKINQKQVKNYIKGIILLPVFYLSWVPINVVAIFEKKSTWERIEHTRTVSLDSILAFNYISKNGVKYEE